MSQRDASIATRRFGLGPRRGDLKRIAADPRGYVVAALARKDAALIADPELEPSEASLMALREAQMRQRDERIAKGVPPAAQEANPQPAGEMKAQPGAPPQSLPGPSPKPGEVRREVFREEARARLARATATDEPFIERLVMFWSNHFTVSALKGPAVRVLAGCFEREAIRPHVLGRFAEMLKAVEQHPAMLIYLDQAQSIGPASPAGSARGRGLNENLAREILELHTLGVAGGYTQADVTSLAKILTGWTVMMQPDAMAAGPAVKGSGPRAQAQPGRFFFAPNRHEPGPQTVLGKRYEDRGLATGEAVLADLARHPATARHIATKLARHFLADAPPPALVANLEATYRKTDGDLAALARTLATTPEPWEMPPRKVVPPYDFVVGLTRAFGLETRVPEALRIAAAIGQPLWAPPSPKGWPDDDDAWMGPSAVRERLRIAERAVRQIDRTLDPRVLAEDLLGEGNAPKATLAIERAEAREQGLELLVMAPEFLRR